ncbi:hypothetical protein, partial [Facilibium subflavum]
MNKCFNLSVMSSIFLLSLIQGAENQKLRLADNVLTNFEQSVDTKKNAILQISERALLLFFVKEKQFYFIVLVNNNGQLSLDRHLYRYENNEYFQIKVADDVYQRLANFVTNNINGLGDLENNQEISLQLSGLFEKSDLANSTKTAAITYHFIGKNKLMCEDSIYMDGTKFERFVLVNKQKRLIEKAIYVMDEDTITVEKEQYNIVPSEFDLPVGSELKAGESWQTDRLKLVMQHDGNLVLYDLLQNALWSSHTKDSTAIKAIVQHNGLVLYDASLKAIWSSGTTSPDKANILKLQKDRNLVLYSDDSKSVWSTHTHTKYDDKVKEAITKADLDGTKKTYVYDKELRILVDDKNNKYSWENNKVVRIEDSRGYIKEYSYNEADGLLKSIIYKDNSQKARLEETFYYKDTAGKPDLYMREIHYIDDNSRYVVETTENTTNNFIYQIKELKPSFRNIAELNYKSNEIGLVTSLSLTDLVNNKFYDTTYHYDEQNQLHNIGVPGQVNYNLSYKNNKAATVTFDNGNNKQIYQINYMGDKIYVVEKQDNHHTKLHYFYDLSGAIVGYKCYSNDSSVCPSIGEAGFLKEEFVLKNASAKVIIDIKKSFDGYYQFTKYNYSQKNNQLMSEKNTRLLGFGGKDKTSETTYSTKDIFYNDAGKLIYDGKTKIIYDRMGSTLQVSSDGKLSIHTASSVVDVHTNKINNHFFDNLTGLVASFEGKEHRQFYMLDLTGNAMQIQEAKTFKDGVKDFFGGIWNFARDVNPYALYLNLAGYDSPVPAYGDESYQQRMTGYGYGIYSASPFAFFTGDYHFFSIKYGLMNSLQMMPVVGSLAQAAYYRYYNAPSMAYYYLGTASADLSLLLLPPMIDYMAGKVAKGILTSKSKLNELSTKAGTYVKGDIRLVEGKIEGHG